MYVAGAPSSYILVNAAALVSGVIVARLVRPAATRYQTFAGAFTLAVALILLATAWVGPRVDGASRWIRLAGLSLQPSLVLLPLALMFFARKQDWLSSIGLAIMAVALALQPDRAMAGTLVAGLAVIRLYRREAVVTMNIVVATCAFASTLVRSDLVPPVPFVEQVLQSAFAFNAVAGLAIVAAFGIMLTPAVVGLSRQTEDPAGYAVFGATWLSVIAFAIIGNYPTPLAGYGASGIAGYCLSAALLRQGSPAAGDS